MPAELSKTERCSAHPKEPLASGAGLRYTQCLPMKCTTGTLAITEQLFVRALLELPPLVQRKGAGRTERAYKRATAAAQRLQTYLTLRH